MRFVHHFAQRYVCEVEVDDQPPEKGAQHHLNFYWSPKLPKPTRQLTKEYTTWICSINKFLADKWNMKLMHCVEVGPDEWQFWGFAPGEEPTLLKGVEAGL
jgi:hypothetical protein